MERIKQIICLFLLMSLGEVIYGQIGIGTTTPSSSAVLDLNSTTAGFLPPRMTYDQINAIVSPVEGLMVYCTDCDPKSIYYFNGTEFLSVITGSGPVTTSVMSSTGKVWMDRNLGASQVATSSTDVASYGDLYQWGRATDGHEKRTSAMTTTIATTEVPGLGNPWDGLYINVASSSPYDWLSSQDDTLWQGVDGTNNPCPSGYRLPTTTEWISEYGSWTGSSSVGAINSPLKLPMAGFRSINIFSAGNQALYWSSTVNGIESENLEFDEESVTTFRGRRFNGGSVRCIKD